MESNKIEELISSFKQSDRRLKQFKQVIEKKREIKKSFSSDVEPDEKTFLQRALFTQQEREIYSSLCQKHDELCRSNETKELYQVILNELQISNLTQLEGYNTKIQDKTKKIKRTTVLQSNLDKFKLFIKKNNRNKLIKKQEKIAYFNNQILSFQTQIVNFNLENETAKEIKIFINSDLLLNINTQENKKKNNTEIPIKNLDSNVEEKKVQDNQCLLKKEKIFVNQKKQLKVLNEDLEKKPETINQSKKINFNQLIYKIDLENKLNQKKLLSKQNQKQVITNPQQKLNNFNLIKDQEIIINDQEDIIEKEDQQKQEKQITQTIQPFQNFNGQEVQSPFKNQEIQKQKDQDLNIIIDPQNNTYEDQDSCQIIDINHFNRFVVEQQIQQRKKDLNQKHIPENKSGYNDQIFEQTKQVLSNQNQKNLLEKFRLLKKEETQISQEGDKIFNFQKIKQFYIENEKKIKKDRFKFIRQQRQLERIKKRQIRKEREQEIKKQLQQEREKNRERLREIVRQKEIELELKKERIIQKEKDTINEIEIQTKLEKKLEKRKKREKLKEMRIQFCKEHDRKERNRSKNRVIKSLSNISQQSNHQKIIQNNSKEQNMFQEQSLENNNQQDQENSKQQIQGNQFFNDSDLYKQKQIEIGQQQQQKEEINLNQNLNTYQYNQTFSQFIPYNLLNYGYQNQAISQFQVPMAFQPYSSLLRNPYHYHQYMPINQMGQQSFSPSDGSYNIYKDQYQCEMNYFAQKTQEHFDPTQYFQLSPRTLVSIPKSSKLDDMLK